MIEARFVQVTHLQLADYRGGCGCAAATFPTPAMPRGHRE